MKILITAPYHKKGRAQLQLAFGQVIYKEWKENNRAFNEDELIALIKETNADALITEHDQVSSKVINCFPELKFIGVCRGTPSNVDLKCASIHGIPIFHTPARNAQAVAEMFIANTINLLRNTFASFQWLNDEKWEAGAHTSYLEFKGNELAGRTIGLVGFGAVAMRIAEMVKAFPCNIKFYDPFIKDEFSQYKKTTLIDVFESCDIVSIHLPVNELTKGLINKSLISRMKPSAIFVNTARAVVVDREALLYAIENSKIRGAILDVFDHEPPDEKDYRLIHHPNVLATPHTAGATYEVEDHHVTILNDKLFNYFEIDSVKVYQQENVE